MEIIKVVAIAIIGTFLAGLVKNLNKEISLYIVMATGIVILFLLIDKLSEIIIYIQGIYSDITYGNIFLPIILKIISIAYLTDFTSQLCKDAGESSIASKVELAGKIIIFYISMPVFTMILELIKGIII